MSYSVDLVEQICARLEIGETMAEICAEPPWPSTKMVYGWINSITYAKERFAHAREIGEDYIAANTRKIARGVKKMVDFSPGLSEQRDKLVVDTDLRLLSFWNPKKYSERKQLDVNINIETISLFEKMELARQQAARKIAAPIIDVTPIIDESLPVTPIIDKTEEDSPLW